MMKLSLRWPKKSYKEQLAEAQQCPATQAVHREVARAKRDRTRQLMDEIKRDYPALERMVTR